MDKRAFESESFRKPFIDRITFRRVDRSQCKVL